MNAHSTTKELFARHSPSKWHWQVWLYNPGRESTGMIFQYPECRSLASVRKTANEMALDNFRRRFAIRSPNGQIVHDGPALDALGNPAPDSWFPPLKPLLADAGERRAA